MNTYIHTHILTHTYSHTYIFSSKKECYALRGLMYVLNTAPSISLLN